MKIDVRVSIPIVVTPRVTQVCGIFDIPPAKNSERSWTVDLPLEEREWSIGLIHGPSGCGKTTIARKVWGKLLDRKSRWPKDRAVVDAFPAALPVKEVVGLLNSVGFSSPPSWLRPFHCLSNGEQFRVSLARLLAECPELAVVDEFTSIVDRTVARVGSAALAKTVRRRGGRFVAVSCHDDIIEWLDPDWTFAPADGSFHWRRERRRGAKSRRPSIRLEVFRCDRQAWRLFGHHHYLTPVLDKTAMCFAGLVEGRPAVFTAVKHFPHWKSSSWREHRTVCLPDFQGVGIGNAMSELIASVFAATGKQYTSVTSHPAMIAHRARSSLWHMHRKPSRVSSPGHTGLYSQSKTSHDRITAGFTFRGAANVEAARALGVVEVGNSEQ